MKVVLRTSVAAAEEFSTPDKMSPRFEKVYQRTLERFAADPAHAVLGRPITPKLAARVIVNGKEFESVEAMPAVYRRFYHEILTRALPIDHAIYSVARTEHVSTITRTVTLSLIALAAAAAVVYLWMHGYYR